jgi:hypothetical protein
MHQRLAHSTLALGVTALLCIKLGKADIGRREARIELAGGSVFRLGLGETPLLQEEVAEVEPVLCPLSDFRLTVKCSRPSFT